MITPHSSRCGARPSVRESTICSEQPILLGRLHDSGAGSDGAGKWLKKLANQSSSPVGECPWMKYQMKKLEEKIMAREDQEPVWQ